ncbi:MAG TPA: 50S ribosomal protein L7ae [Ruminiclostridium sp.]|jgi:ribosomal protein L7Ae-like RNA K-turn-binding protein|nr:50S ribosomal protein L7ae [Clostridiaceae bacterium]HAA24895.1 50S ribosomal protein L7ae [Ruminiclostridium sp.]
MVKDRVYSFIGLAMKAGKLVSGGESCERAIKRGNVYLLIVSEDASDNTVKKFEDACKHRKIPLCRFGEKEAMGRLLGKKIRSVVAVTDVGLARNLEKLIDEQKGRGNKHGGELIEQKDI